MFAKNSNNKLVFKVFIVTCALCENLKVQSFSHCSWCVLELLRMQSLPVEQGGVVCTERGGSLTQGWLKGKRFGRIEKLNLHKHCT